MSSYRSKLNYNKKLEAAMSEKEINSTAYEKWEFDIGRSGFSVIPNQVFFINQFLPESERLSSTEVLLLLNLLTWWWEKDSMPFPTKGLLSTRLGISERQIQRAIKTLENKNLLRSIPRFENGKQRSNQYDLSLFANYIKQKVGQIYGPTAEREKAVA